MVKTAGGKNLGENIPEGDSETSWQGFFMTRYNIMKCRDWRSGCNRISRVPWLSAWRLGLAMVLKIMMMMMMMMMMVVVSMMVMMIVMVTMRMLLM